MVIGIDSCRGDPLRHRFVVAHVNGSVGVKAAQQLAQQRESLGGVLFQTEEQITDDLSVALGLLALAAGGKNEELLTRKQSGEDRYKSNRKTRKQFVQVSNPGDGGADVEEVVLQPDLEGDGSASLKFRAEANGTPGSSLRPELNGRIHRQRSDLVRANIL